jgi:hypothetical protein
MPAPLGVRKGRASRDMLAAVGPAHDHRLSFADRLLDRELRTQPVAQHLDALSETCEPAAALAGQWIMLDVMGSYDCLEETHIAAVHYVPATRERARMSPRESHCGARAV